eukprot:m.279563 g.279563  ORF g.279563 m.279563 type:complete len:291 (-) comp16323_c11_seq18:311-1183(-)
MVKLNVKRGDNQLFLYETLTSSSMEDVLQDIVKIYNEILRLNRLADEIDLLAAHGISKPPKAIGLTDEQIEEMKIVDEYTPKCTPSGGTVFQRDDIGRRTGNAPTAKLAEVLRKTCADAKAAVAPTVAAANKCLTLDIIKEEINKLKGATMIVYPMGLPPYDPVQDILDDNEDLAGTQDSTKVIPLDEAQLWWAGKELMRGKKLCDYIGKNEKTKIVTKLQKRGGGAPVREPVVDEELQKKMMAWQFQRQEEMKKLEEVDDDDYLNSPWADSRALKNRLQGTGNIGWNPR